ncbi:winged helix DNA-binding domain-containing protein [Streptomyces sp. RTGN2]|uniref:winged helix DNA-binding domain-containing protein n=1 Tax=Streptomyces sp. RTGN2 TaxID=3016525 RepID=UPI002555EE50|nr:winged helix DNA-binding domain-containing protein [Streptomyces sp. RTGN2]
MRLTERRLTLRYLERQLLLARSPMGSGQAVRLLLGLQAQYSPSPYLALLARLDGASTTGLEDCLRDATVVKSTLMRGTLHLVAGADYPVWGEIWREQATEHWSRRCPGLDEKTAAAVAEFTREPREREELRAFMGELTGDAVTPRELLHVARALVPLVQPPPSGFWRHHGKASLQCHREPPELVGPAAMGRWLRAYLTAYGPAGLRDAAKFAGLTVGRVRAGLPYAGPVERLEGPDGRDLLDVPDAMDPDEGVRVPFRLLPKWDSALLAHTDRGRIMDPEVQRRVVNRSNGDVAATYLVDGRVAGTWSAGEKGSAARLVLTPLVRAELPDDAEPEGVRLLRFLHPRAARHSVEAAPFDGDPLP